MYHPSTACVEKEGWVEYNSWTKIFVTVGARGVSLKLNFLLISVWSERLGFVLEYWSRLRVMKAWGVRRYHSWEVKLGLQEASPEQRLFLNVRIARSAALRRWVYKGTSWKSTLYVRKAFCMVWENSLSRMWRVGDVPCRSSFVCHVVQAVVISRAYRFLRRWAWMELVS